MVTGKNSSYMLEPFICDASLPLLGGSPLLYAGPFFSFSLPNFFHRLSGRAALLSGPRHSSINGQHTVN